MTFSQKITLSLFLAGANAATIQPTFATGTVGDLKYASDIFLIATQATGGTSAQYDAIQEAKANAVEITLASDSTNHAAGLYGCIMSDLLAFGTQGFVLASGATQTASLGAQESGA